MPRYRKLLINGMTPKQSKLLKVLARQIKEKGSINLTQAGLEVYDTKSPNTASAIVNETLEKPNVQEALDTILRGEGLDLTTLVGEAGKIANHEVEKVSADVKLRAIVELLKLHRAYPDKKTAHLNVNLSGKIKDMDYKQAKEQFTSINSKASTLIGDVE